MWWVMLLDGWRSVIAAIIFGAMTVMMMMTPTYSKRKASTRTSSHTMSTASSTASSTTETTGSTTALGMTMTITANLSQWQEKAAPIAASFVVDEDFRPFLTNRHVQTIGGLLFKDTCSYLPLNPFQASWHIVAAISNKILSKLLGKRTKNSKDNSNTPEQQQFWHHRERIETPDGDWFHADCRFATSSTSSTTESLRPIVLLLYGIASDSYSPNVMEMAKAVNDIGMDCVCLNYRGCCGTPTSQFRGKHLGFTQDLYHYLELLKQRRQQQDHATQGAAAPPIYLSGLSMGGNIILKCLGELGERAMTEYNIQGAAVWSTPLDQSRNYAFLQQPGINRWIYIRRLLRTSKQTMQERLELCYQNLNKEDNKSNNGQSFDDFIDSFDLFDVRAVMAAQTIAEFDDPFHRGVHGFTNCWDYYRQTSSIHVLDQVAVPTVLLGAQDDPLFDPAVWPVELSRVHDANGSAPLKFIRTAYGGHLGYCFHQVDQPDDSRLLPLPDNGGLGQPPSWAPVQLARFLEHVEKNRLTLDE